MPTTCVAVHFLHVVKCGGTTIRGWMRELVTRDGFEFASHYDVASCVPKNGSNRHACWEPQVAAAMRIREAVASGSSPALRLLHEWHSPNRQFMYWANRSIIPFRPLLRSRGCRVVLAMMLREPLSLYRSWHRYISTQGWGALRKHVRHGGSPVALDVWLNASAPLPPSRPGRVRGSKAVALPPLRHAPRNLQTINALKQGTCMGDGDDDGLCGSGDGPLRIRGGRLLDTMDVIGVTEHLEGFVLLLCEAMGLGATGCARVVARNRARPAGGAMTGGGGPYSALRARWAASELLEQKASVLLEQLAPVDIELYARARSAYVARAPPATLVRDLALASVRRAAATPVEGTVQAAQLGVWAQLGNWADDDPEAKRARFEWRLCRPPFTDVVRLGKPYAEGAAWRHFGRGPPTATTDGRRWGLVRRGAASPSCVRCAWNGGVATGAACSG